MPETPQPQQLNPRERLPIGMKVPDKLKGAIAKYEAKIVADAETRQKEINDNNVRIIPPEQVARIRAAAEAKIAEQRKKIGNMN